MESCSKNIELNMRGHENEIFRPLHALRGPQKACTNRFGLKTLKLLLGKSTA